MSLSLKWTRKDGVDSAFCKVLKEKISLSEGWSTTIRKAKFLLSWPLLGDGFKREVLRSYRGFVIAV